VKQLSNETIERTLRPYGVSAGALLCDQIRVYIDLLLRWNQKTSLTSVTDPTEILRFHFGESVFAVSTVPIRHGRLADVGSGAGFPAVPIRMVSERLSVILIESNQKNATFLMEVARALGLEHIDVRRCRMDSVALDEENEGEVDFITARALGIDDRFLDWAHKSLNSRGSVVLWLGTADASEISQKRGWKWADSILIPQSNNRVILHGSKL
jgi:16S rRNA (guanine(527)-N(7))-methyltransferase RsmG